MRLLFVADGRSQTALSWLRYWIETDHQIHLISTFPCKRPSGLKSFDIIPVAFGGLALGKSPILAGGTTISHFVPRFRNILRLLRYYLGPLTLPYHQKRFLSLVEEIQPNLVHALRIPFEGMLASAVPVEVPMVVSVWGNDFTLHSHGSILMACYTQRTLHRASALVTDATRDIRLGHDLGFASNKPTLIVPGSGGIHLEEMVKITDSIILPEALPEVPVVVNPRGQRPGSLRQDIFFQAIPLVLEKTKNVLFICPQLAGDKESEQWVESLGIREHAKLWPYLDKEQMWMLFKKTRVFVSPSIHDGTPNSLLEAMACGCFPVVGNIESMQEWINSGVNGLLVDSTSPRALADGILTALKNPDLCHTASIENARIIAERANYQRCMAMAEVFYQQIAKG
jgi:glycosyltransferase involved in cell wall biosynthesis